MRSAAHKISPRPCYALRRPVPCGFNVGNSSAQSVANASLTPDFTNAPTNWTFGLVTGYYEGEPYLGDDAGSTAIDAGIQQSAVWPQATVYQNQQVYLRDLSNHQVLATVDRVVAYGNQRWLINYGATNGSLGLFNITPVVYSLDQAAGARVHARA